MRSAPPTSNRGCNRHDRSAARNRLGCGASRRSRDRLGALRRRAVGRARGGYRPRPADTDRVARRRILRALPRRHCGTLAAGAVAASHRNGGVRAGATARRPRCVHPATGDRSHLGVGHRAAPGSAAGDCRCVHRIGGVGGGAGPAPARGPDHRYRRLCYCAGVCAPQRRGQRTRARARRRYRCGPAVRTRRTG